MIKIANTYNKGSFLTKDIDKYHFENKFNLIFSMETLYYLKDISALLTKIYNDGLHKNGMLIIGLDHYKENEPSLSWGDDYNLDISTLSIEEWKNKLTESKFRNIDIIQFNKKDDSIYVKNLDGPLKHLENKWHFREENNFTEVSFDVDFELKNHFLNIIITKSFQFALDKIIDAFQKRAEELFSKT